MFHTLPHKVSSPAPFDFSVLGSGTVYLLVPRTQAAREWASEHISSEAQMLGSGIAVEHRYIADIVDGIQADGLTIH